MANRARQWDLETDVLVAGSGGAGLTAAVAAHDGGAGVAVIERSDKIGGTTAVSGGVFWIPLNHHMADVGVDDSKQEAMTYIRRLAGQRFDEALVEAFLDNGQEMVRHLEECTSLRFVASDQPDYHPEFEGAKLSGRALNVCLFEKKELGEWGERLRPAPIFNLPVTIGELTGWGVPSDPGKLPVDVIQKRIEQGLIGCGNALIGGLLKGCLDRGIEPTLNTRGRRLVIEDGCVVGVEAERDGEEFDIRCGKGVVLATGGFEWNEKLRVQFLPGPLTHPNSPPFNEGDGLLMAMQAGADLDNMSEAWWFPSLSIPGEEYEGRPLSRVGNERSLPHSIIVNRYGRRFVNEAHNYNDITKTFHTVDPVNYEHPNIPAWLIVDQNFMTKHALLTIIPGEEVPAWLDRADTLEALAQKVGIDSEGLQATVERFNEFALEGMDHDFHRGRSAYDRYDGDADHKPNPCLGSIQKSPFAAVPIYPGALGTKGGPRVNQHGQVMSVYGKPIPGLYAAGNTMATFMGPGYGGGGGSLGPGLTSGYIAGKHASRH